MESNFFKENDYLVVRNIIDPADYYDYINKLATEAKEGHMDVQVEGTRAFYKNPRFEKLLEDLTPVIEKYTGLSLYKTYSYARKYDLGNVLKAHYDRTSCEVTVSIALGYSDKCWPICLLDKNEQPVSVELEPGDCLIFRGMDHTHWREKNVYGPSANVFLHYVDKNGPYAIHRDDKKLGNWFTIKMFKKEFKFSIMPHYRK